MANPRLNTRQQTWLKNFLMQYPYYKKQRIWEGLSGDRFLLLEGTERLPLPLIREFEGASPGYRLHTLQVQLRIYGDVRKTALHQVTTVYPHCNIGDKITGKQTEGQLSLSLSTALEIPEPVNPVIVNWKPKRKARAKLGTQLSMPVTGLEAKLFALRQKARPHLPPISAQDLAQEKVATWSARDHKEVELPQVIVDLLLEKNADDDEWQSAIDLFGVIGLPGVLRYLEQLPSIRQHFNRVTSMASASAQVSPAALATITETQQVSLAPKVNQMKRIIALTLSISSLIFPPLAIAQTANIALRKYIRTVFESGINTIAKALKFTPSLSHPIFEHEPPMLNLVQVWRIGWQIPNFTPRFSNHLLNALRVVETRIIDHDDISRLQLWNKALLEPHLKQVSIA